MLLTVIIALFIVALARYLLLVAIDLIKVGRPVTVTLARAAMMFIFTTAATISLVGYMVTH